MNWIKVSTNLVTKPAVASIAQQTKEPMHAVVGRLLLVWCWADPLTIDGLVPHANAALIDKIAGKRGFAAAMLSVDWLAVETGGVRFPNWERHNSRSAKARAGEAERKRMQRGKSVGTVGGEQPTAAPAPAAPAPAPAPIVRAPVAAAPKAPIVPISEPALIRQSYPAALASSAAFVECWEQRWLPYISARNPSRAPTIQTLESHLGTCLKLGPATAVAALTSAIEKGWAAPDANVKPVAGLSRPSDTEPDDWKAYWRETFPPEDFTEAPRYENGDWKAVPNDYKRIIRDGLAKRHRRSA